MSEISDLKRRIAAGEYKLDAGAIAEAMFSRADGLLAGARGSAVLEARKGERTPPSVDKL